MSRARSCLYASTAGDVVDNGGVDLVVGSQTEGGITIVGGVDEASGRIKA
jgi:hypothetical protein